MIMNYSLHLTIPINKIISIKFFLFINYYLMRTVCVSSLNIEFKEFMKLSTKIWIKQEMYQYFVKSLCIINKHLETCYCNIIFSLFSDRTK